MALDYGLKQIVNKPTRGNNYLDLIFTNLNVNSINIDQGISDHSIIEAALNHKVGNGKQEVRWIYNYNKIDSENLMKQMDIICTDFEKKTENWSTNDTWMYFKKALLESWDNNVPKKMLKKKQDKPWFNKTIKKLLTTKKKTRLKARNSNKEEDWERYKITRTQVKNELTKAKKNYMHKLGENMNTNPKAFWSFLKKIRQNKNSIPDLEKETLQYTKSQDKANLLNDTFKEAFQNIEKNWNYKQENTENTLPPFTVTNIGVENLIKELHADKSAGPDKITAKMLQATLPISANCLTVIFNKSITQGKIPQDWREAAVVPIYKKGNKANPENYRPISLTCIACKILEHIIVSYIYKYLEENNILNMNQFGFRKGSSCEHLLLVLNEFITTNLDKGIQVDLLLFDIQRAFDKVKHGKLIQKLIDCGLNVFITNWITDFLKNRTQVVLVEGEKSKPCDVTSGVPQGTVSAPVLFLIFINDLPTVIKVLCLLFADDTALCNPICSIQDSLNLQAAVIALEEWCTNWELPLNAAKTQLIRITKKRENNIIKFDYHVQGIPIVETKQAKYLGVQITHNWSWSPHITWICGKARKALAFVGRNLWEAEKQTKIIAINALVFPNIEYAAAIWDPFIREDINKIEAIQRRASRVVVNSWGRDVCVTNLINKLNWCTLQIKRKEHRLALLYNIYNKNSIIETENLLEKPDYIARGDHSKKIKVHHSKHNVSRYSFFTNTIFDWNKLTEEIVSAPNCSIFKERLKKIRTSLRCRNHE